MKKWVLLFIMLIYIIPPQFSYAQNRRVFNSTEQDAMALLDKAEKTYLKNVPKALDFIEEALLIALRENNLPAQGRSYQLLGDINAHLKQYDLAAANYERALVLFSRAGMQNKIQQLHKLSGAAYEKAGNLDKALENYEAFLKENDNTSLELQNTSRSNNKQKDRLAGNDDNDLNEAEEVRLAMSAIYARQQRYDLSLKNLKEVASEGDTAQNTSKKIIINDKLGDVYAEQDQDDEALSYYNSNASSARKANKPKQEGKANTKIARILESNKKEEEALKFRDRSIEIYNLTKDTVNLAREYLAKGQLLNNLDLLPASEASLSSAIDLAISTSEKNVEREGYLEISIIEEKRGHANQSLEYYKKYVALQDEAFKEKEAELEAKLALNTSLNQQQQRMEMLEKSEAINKGTIEVLQAKETIAQKSATNQRLIIYGLLLVILFLGISGYLMYKNMQRRRVANQLLALKSLRAQMNPHFIFNALNSVNHYISQKDERAANKYLSDFSRLMRAVLEHSQEDFIDLAKELEIISLYLNLEHNRFSEKFDFSLKIDDELDTEAFKIPPMLVQPYIENAIWHGLRYRETKGQLIVSYQKENTLLLITIEDNGIGRTRSQTLKTQNQKKNTSTGMNNIEDRVRIINNMYSTAIEVQIEDLDNDGGTRVVLKIPTTVKSETPT